MKKRGQQPDAHTYTIVLRGLASNANFGKSLERALTVYHSMCSPDSRVRPNIIHTNAAIKVCAQAGNLDALFGVAARLPRSGPRAADRVTFTTVFNALNRIVNDADERNKDETLQENMDKRQKAVTQGRRMWAEIIERWNHGDMMLDETLICATGRLLLLADVHQDMDDVLSLLEQTMGIPRQSPRRHRDRAWTLPEKDDESPAQGSSELLRPIKLHSQPFVDVADEFVPGEEFLPLPNVQPMAYAVPSRSTLSLVLDACTRLRLFSAAQDYWGLLTGPSYNITPDTDNYHMYLRLLRAQRASRQCVELVQEMRGGLGASSVTGTIPYYVRGEPVGVHAKTFRIALGACRRDIENPSVVSHAAKLVRMMYDSLPEADLNVLNTYVEISREAASHDWQAMSSALRGTEVGIRQLQASLPFATAHEDKKSDEYLDRCREIHAFLATLIGAYDQLLDPNRFRMLMAERQRAWEQMKILWTWQENLSRELGILPQSRDIWWNGRMNTIKLQRARKQERMAKEREARKQEAREKRKAEAAAIESEFPKKKEEEEEEDEGDDEEKKEEIPEWKKEAQLALRKAQKYTQGGANKRMAMAQYLRRIQNESM